jgi:sodium transport system permease protein
VPSRSKTLVVLAKELRETFRDKRVILGAVVSPLLITPLLFAAIGFFFGQKTIAEQAEVLPVAVVGGEHLPELLELIEARPTLRLETTANAESAEQAVRSRTLRAAAVIPATAPDQLAAGQSAQIELLFDAANEKSSNAQERLQESITEFNRLVTDRRLAERGLDRAFIRPIETSRRNLATDREVASFLLGLILPYVIILGAAFGGMTTAFDVCAGEKERGTLETLLVSPASRSELVTGKLLAVWIVSLLSALCSVGGLVIALFGGLQFIAPEMAGRISVSLGQLGLMLLAVAPLALMTSSILLVISAYSRNQKEAQALVFPLITIIILPALLSSILGAESALWIATMPILNTALAMKQALGNVVSPAFLAIALFTSLIYAGLAMRLAVAMFQRESILFRT